MTTKKSKVTNNKEPFYPKLAGKMAETGTSPEELANLLGMHKMTFYRKYKGELKGFNIEQGIVISQRLSCSLNDIFLTSSSQMATR